MQNYLLLDSLNNGKVHVSTSKDDAEDKIAVCLADADISFGVHGELIIITEPCIDEKLCIKRAESSHKNSEFITLHKADAENILSMLNQAISKLESGTRTDNDVEVFGEKAISYERLIDKLDGLIMPESNTPRFKSWKEYGEGVREYTQKKDNDK